jgi:quercetin dioxygenase-like cupin family protein
MRNLIILPHDIGEGKDLEIQNLLADRWRRLVIIQLRRGSLLADHSARFPITIQTLAGTGTLHVGSEEYELSSGVLVPVDAHVIHSVQGNPDVSILVTFFRQTEPPDGNDISARFD